MLCPAPAGFGPRAALRIAQGEGTVGLGGGCSLAACTEAQEGAGTSEKLGREICSPGLKAGQALSLQVPQLHTPLLFFFSQLLSLFCDAPGGIGGRTYVTRWRGWRRSRLNTAG